VVKKVEIGAAVLYLGDCMEIMPGLPPVAAVITDPPYASGGMYRADRTMSVKAKYVSGDVKRQWRAFSGDAKDQRSWMNWCVEWLKRLPIEEGAYVLSFIDWRQLPALSDAFQWAGLMWRGVAAWDKGLGARAPHKGYLKHQCEYIVWGTAGKIPIAEHAGPFPGAYRATVLQADKHHMTGKPTALMRELVRIVPEGAQILDQFMGSGTTGVAAVLEGRRFVGIECDPEHFAVACRRIAEAQGIPWPPAIADVRDAYELTEQQAARLAGGA
jgi:site-specific DNA-methyltransferase (adenine-specific)